MKTHEEQTLYFCRDGSDKVYQTSLIELSTNEYVVNIAYGRRGSTFATTTKTNKPVIYNVAKAIYDKALRAKIAKGYTAGESGTPYLNSDKKTTDILPQLLNSISLEEVTLLLEDDKHCMQEKHDGRRLQIQKRGTVITGINKLGLTIGLPWNIVEALSGDVDFTIDGEIVGEHYYIFDIRDLGKADITKEPYITRYGALCALVLDKISSDNISVVDTYMTPSEKRNAFKRLDIEGKEGAVFKRLDALYTSGRPNSGGAQLKYKFCESASFIVDKVNDKRSVALKLHDGTEVGNCSIPPNKEIPVVGDVVEVRYLYAYKGGSIIQPFYLGKRDDINADECTVDQLKFKAE